LQVELTERYEGLPYIRKWHNSLREGKSLDRHMAASFILKWQYSLWEKQVELKEHYEGLSLYPKMA